MTSKKTLNPTNLEALGAERLAELLIEISKGRPAARRLLRLELAGAEGTAELAREVRHRMATIRRSRAVIDSRRRRDLVDDLELCRRTIVDRIPGEDASEALDLMWQYMGLANPIQNRLHYTDETIVGAFSASDPGDIASSASPDPHKLAERAFEALTQNAHGQYDGLIGALMPTLGHEGLERLKQLMTEYSNTPAVQLPEAHRRKIHWRHLGTDIEAETAERLRLQTARSALQDTGYRSCASPTTTGPRWATRHLPRDGTATGGRGDGRPTSWRYPTGLSWSRTIGPGESTGSSTSVGRQPPIPPNARQGQARWLRSLDLNLALSVI